MIDSIHNGDADQHLDDALHGEALTCVEANRAIAGLGTNANTTLKACGEILELSLQGDCIERGSRNWEQEAKDRNEELQRVTIFSDLNFFRALRVSTMSLETSMALG
jgi:hypothetical protein